MDKKNINKLKDRIEKKLDRLTPFIPERFPEKEELSALYLKDPETTLLLLVWLVDLSGRTPLAEEETAYIYARKIIRENTYRP